MSIQSDKLLKILEKIATREGIESFEPSFSAGSNKGENFLGEITRVQLSGKNSLGKEKNLDLILKCAPSSAKRREDFLNHIVFEREVFFYKTLAPKFLSFQQEKGLSADLIFSAYPRCLEAICDVESEDFLLVFENLRAQDFHMLPRDKPHSVSSLRLVVRTLAKYHAVSFAFKDQQPSNFEEFKGLHDIFTQYTMSPVVRQTFDASFVRTIELLEDPKHIRILKELMVNVDKHLANLYDAKALDRCGIIAHGDVWNNNLFFHETNNEADDLRFLDWQILRYSSPVLDLLYYLFSSTDKKVRKEEYENLLRIYYDQLALNIRALGSDPDRLFTFDDLQSELRRCGVYGLMRVQIIVQINLSKSDDIPDMNEMCDQATNYDFVQNSDSEFEGKFKERMSGIVADLLEWGYIKDVDEI